MLARRAHTLGWQFGFHAIGDRAIAETVDIIARILDASPRDDHRHYLNHFTVMPPAQVMEKMAAYDIAITQQPNFAYTLEGRYAEHLTADRLAHNNPMRTPMDHGIFVAMSSDVLPIGPMTGIYAAVTRKGMSGTVYGPDESISIEEALRAYTLFGAILNGDGDKKGTLTPGKYADLIVLDRNLLTIDPEAILDTKVDLTVLAGAVVFER